MAGLAMDTTKSITVNGTERAWHETTLRGLLEEMEIDAASGGVAVAVNADVVPRAAWQRTPVSPGDRIEIVHIVRGG